MGRSSGAWGLRSAVGVEVQIAHPVRILDERVGAEKSMLSERQRSIGDIEAALDADHSFPSGRGDAEVIREVLEATSDWIDARIS